MEEVKKKRGRPRKTQLPEEIQKIIEDVQTTTTTKEHEQFLETVREMKQERRPDAFKWDVTKDDQIRFFDKRLSYELTGYRPITDKEGLDFDPKWFTRARETYLATGHYTDYRFRTKAYDEFWDEEYRRCKYGYTVNGYTVPGPYYYYLNYYQLPNIDVEKAGSGRSAIFPKFLVFQYEFFHYFELCRTLKKDVCLMKSRGIGFSEINAAICACIYNCFSSSNCMISANNKNYLDKSLDKVWGALDFANDNTDGGMAKLRQAKNTQYLKRASTLQKDQNGIEKEVGWKSQIEGVIADTDAKIRGDRVDLLVYEEAGSNPVLRKSYIKGKALIYIGGSKFGIRMAGGTGGDKGVALADLKAMYEDPTSYDVLPFYHNYTPSGEWIYTSYFIPSYIGAVTEYGVDANGVKRRLLDERGYCLWENYKAQLDVDREVIKDPKALIDHCAEYCYTADEAFALEGENKFNKVNIVDQLTRIKILKQGPKPELGSLDFVYKNGNHSRENITGVKWIPSDHGKVKIIEHPLWAMEESLDEEGNPIALPKEPMKDLYVAGVDGIDIGQSQTSDYTKDPSDFCIVIKKRVYGNQPPQYVAIYKDRPNDVRDAYKIAIRLAMYYNAQINIEATRMSLVTWAREHKFLHLFMKRPSATYPDITKRKSTQYGSPATAAVIAHQTDLIADYVNDYCYTIWFEEMLNELNSYSDETKRKFDIVAAMGEAELADEEKQGSVPKAIKTEAESYEDVGYYYDENGVKRFGVIPKQNQNNVRYNMDFGQDNSFNRSSNPRYR